MRIFIVRKSHQYRCVDHEMKEMSASKIPFVESVVRKSTDAVVEGKKQNQSQLKNENRYLSSVLVNIRQPKCVLMDHKSTVERIDHIHYHYMISNNKKKIPPKNINLR